MRLGMIVFSAVMAMTASADAADYRDARHHARRPVLYVPIHSGIRPAPPLYIVAAPPRYVEDTRTGYPGRWVVTPPSLAERLFGTWPDYE